MTDEARQKVSRHALVALVSAAVGGTGGIVTVSASYGRAEERMVHVERATEKCEADRGDLRREISEVRAMVQAHNLESETKWREIQRRWDEARQGVRR